MSTQLDLDHDLELLHPKEYKVYLLNDDYTSMDFVVDILMTVFHKSHEEAQKVMLDIHQNNQGLCGVYSLEIAETKVIQVRKKARDANFPLKAVMEEA